MTIKKIGKNYSWEGRKATKKIQDESVSSRVRSGDRVGGRQEAGEPRAGVKVGGVQTWVHRSPHWPTGVARGGPLQRNDLNLQVQQLPLCEIIKRRKSRSDAVRMESNRQNLGWLITASGCSQGWFYDLCSERVATSLDQLLLQRRLCR